MLKAFISRSCFSYQFYQLDYYYFSYYITLFLNV